MVGRGGFCGSWRGDGILFWEKVGGDARVGSWQFARAWLAVVI